jgi:hypothetical protein
LLKKVQNGDVLAAELIVGVSDSDGDLAKNFAEAKVTVKGVKGAMEAACERLGKTLSAK